MKKINCAQTAEFIWTGFTLVWSLITRIPIPKALTSANFTLPTADAMIFLPLAGGLFGLVAALPAWLISPVIPTQGAAWFAAALYTALGWSLHLDGWGDVWDGIGSGKRGDSLRNVMKDARIGAFGAAGIVAAIGIRAALLGGMDREHWLAACIVSCGVGRFGCLAAIYPAKRGKYPWAGGMARDIVLGFRARHAVLAAALTCLIFPVWPAAWIVGMAVSCAGGAAFAIWAEKRMGGVNGDVIGASAVLGEILTMTACAALAV